MKKILLAILTFSLILLVGCESNKTSILDTSNLIEIEKGAPAKYEAPTVQDGINALPFKVKLPKKFPFGKVEYLPPTIADFNVDGEHLIAEFMTTKIEDGIDVNITAYYPKDIVKGEPRDPSKNHHIEVKLKKGVIGRYNNSVVFFDINDVTFKLIYFNMHISEEQNKKEIIRIANQMY